MQDAQFVLRDLEREAVPLCRDRQMSAPAFWLG
jgi:hypothetical protein